MHCLRDGDEQHIRPLVTFGHDIDGKDVDGNTPLHSAAINGQAAVLRMLIMCNADPNIANNRGQDALLCAVRSKINTLVRPAAFLALQTCMHTTLSLSVAACNTACGCHLVGLASSPVCKMLDVGSSMNLSNTTQGMDAELCNHHAWICECRALCAR